jgi:2-acylglycerol O-acyltransferase 2
MKKYSLKRDVWESFCVLVVILTLPTCLVSTVVLLTNRYTRYPFIIGYALWTVVDRTKKRKGNQKGPWWCGKMRQLKGLNWLIKGVRGYFDGAEIKFVDKMAIERIEGPIIFGCHPHGIFGLSPLINFGIGAFEGGVAEALPKSKPIHVLTLRFSFLIPFWRDLLMRFGLGPVDKETCRRVLKDAGHSIAVVVGGAREALYARPGHYEIILKKRKGLFKLSVELKTPIVPVFCFGDVDIYDQVPLPWPFSLLQALSMKLTGFSLPLPTGRFGTLLPLRRRLKMIFGKPIDSKGMSVDELHQVYMDQVKEIYFNYQELEQGKGKELIIK